VAATSKPVEVRDTAIWHFHSGKVNEILTLQDQFAILKQIGYLPESAAYYSEEAIQTVRDFAASEVVRVLTGQPPLSPVNAVQIADTRRAAGSGPISAR
jgi:hypothetical protein